jgi:cholesterol transport system auxiliary component
MILPSFSRRQGAKAPSLPLKLFVVLVPGLLLGLTTGCSGLALKRPSQIYLLPTESVEVVEERLNAPLPLSLRINRPVATGVLASRKIAVLPEGNRIEVYADSLWNAPPAQMLRDRLLETLTREGTFSSLSSDTAALYADYSLDSDLRAFQSVYRDGQPIARISLDVRLVHLASRKIIGTSQFDVTEPAHGKTVEEVVTALGRASDRLAAEMSLWLDSTFTHDAQDTKKEPR